MLNSKQVDQLFQQNAMLLISEDVVPLYRVVDLFGERAARFACKAMDSKDCVELTLGGRRMCYLKYEGFQMAASHLNVQMSKAEAASKMADIMTEIAAKAIQS